MIISRTPLRISFFGGGTDYPAWYREHGGAVLATSINKYCYINCRYQPPFFESRYRIAYRKIELCKSIDEIEHPSVRACLEFMQLGEGIEMVYAGDLPANSGLGSSSTFTVGLLNALYALQGKMTSQGELARQAIDIEQNRIGEPVGSQDQVMAAYGGLRVIHFGKDLSVQPLVLSNERNHQLQDHLMLFYTGVRRYGAEIARDKIDNIPKRTAQLQRLHAQVGEAATILSSGDLDDFGHMLDETWQLKQSLSDKVSSPAIADIYATAKRHGALGGKLLGAGGGRSGFRRRAARSCILTVAIISATAIGIIKPPPCRVC
jgi:D-glycero-alpha-D-manno-heptose-7-phosphate kinase